jgi:hypothetical protein
MDGLQSESHRALLRTMVTVGTLISALIWVADQLRDILMRRRTTQQRERQIVFALLTFLDGRRVLFDPWTIEEPHYVAASVLEVRARVEDDLANLKPDAKAIASLRAIRTGCLQYLTRVPRPEDAEKHWPHAINDLRAAVGSGIEDLERDYQMAMPGGTGRDPGRVIYVARPGEIDR